MTTQKTFIKSILSNKQNMGDSRYVIFSKTRNWMWPLIDENKIQFDKKNNKNWKAWKMFESVDHKF